MSINRIKRLTRKPVFLKSSLQPHFCTIQQKAPYNKSPPYNAAKDFRIVSKCSQKIAKLNCEIRFCKLANAAQEGS